MSLERDLRALVAAGRLDLPAIGDGATSRRWQALAELARHDVAVARVAEAHVDGRQILHEAGRDHAPARLLGVWASEGARPGLGATVERTRDRITLHGSKAFCTGAGIVDDALVTAVVAGEPLLLLVPTDRLEPERVETDGWATPALAATRTAVVDFEGVEVGSDAVVGAPGWYLARTGFWHGAIGPAACWGGAALGLVDYATAHAADDPHDRAHLGAMQAGAWAIASLLDAAGRAADADPEDAGEAQRRALVVRHLIDERCASIQDHFGRALGPRPLAADGAVAQRYAALTLYRRQCHAERDLESLGRLPPPPGRPAG